MLCGGVGGDSVLRLFLSFFEIKIWRKNGDFWTVFDNPLAQKDAPVRTRHRGQF